MNTWLPAWLRRAIRRLCLLLAGMSVALLASCGGGSDATRYRSVAMAGELIDYTLDTADLSYSYTITESSYGLTGTTASGTLTQNADGTYTPSLAPDSRVVVLPSGVVLGAVRERFGDAVATMPFIGLAEAATTSSDLSAEYNYVHRGCVAAQCQASHGTFLVDTTAGTWRSCRSGNLAAGACVGTTANGTLEPRGDGQWRVRGDDGSEIGTAIGLDSEGQKLLVIDLKDQRPDGFGTGMLIGGQQANMSSAVSDGSWIAGMNTGTWFAFTASGSDIAITELNFQPVDIAVTIAANAPWTGMTTTAWGEIGFISSAGVYLLMTPGGDLELGVKLR